MKTSNEFIQRNYSPAPNEVYSPLKSNSAEQILCYCYQGLELMVESQRVSHETGQSLLTINYQTQGPINENE